MLNNNFKKASANSKSNIIYITLSLLFFIIAKLNNINYFKLLFNFIQLNQLINLKKRDKLIYKIIYIIIIILVL